MADGNLAPFDPTRLLRTAPHNLDAEQALIGAILIDNQVTSRFGDMLKPLHFYDPVHGRIYETISRMIQKGALADGITLNSLKMGRSKILVARPIWRHWSMLPLILLRRATMAS